MRLSHLWTDKKRQGRVYIIYSTSYIHHISRYAYDQSLPPSHTQSVSLDSTAKQSEPLGKPWQACRIASDLGSPVTAGYRVATTAKNTAVQLSAISHRWRCPARVSLLLIPEFLRPQNLSNEQYNRSTKRFRPTDPSPDRLVSRVSPSPPVVSGLDHVCRH